MKGNLVSGLILSLLTIYFALAGKKKMHIANKLINAKKIVQNLLYDFSYKTYKTPKSLCWWLTEYLYKRDLPGHSWDTTIKTREHETRVSDGS